jgi:hypothetical protein
MIQETLEDAIGNWIDKNCDRTDGLETLSDAIKFGYKLAQEQDKNKYSAEEVDELITLLKSTTEHEVLESFRNKVSKFEKFKNNTSNLK